jgi:hypothetical protein
LVVSETRNFSLFIEVTVEKSYLDPGSWRTVTEVT